MLKNKKKTECFPLSCAFVIVVIFSLMVIYLLYTNYKLENEMDMLKTILSINLDSARVSSISQKADSYYELANRAYEYQDYKNVEYNCKIARDYYHEASLGYLELKTKLKGNDTLIKKYKNVLDLLSEIQLNMYEACEHFESASRYYDIYYNTNVSVYDNSYYMGGQEIDAMNEKIKLHDENVKKYNNLVSEISKELEKMIK